MGGLAPQMVTTTITTDDRRGSASPGCPGWPASSRRTRSWHAAYSSGHHRVMWLLAAAGRVHDVVLYRSGCCSWRSYGGPRMTREVAHHVHESPRRDDVAADGSWRCSRWSPASRSGIPSDHGTRFERFLAPVLPRSTPRAAQRRGARCMLLISAVGGRRRASCWRGSCTWPRRCGPTRSAARARRSTACCSTPTTWTEIYDRLIVRPAAGALAVPGAASSTSASSTGSSTRSGAPSSRAAAGLPPAPDGLRASTTRSRCWSAPSLIVAFLLSR